MRSEQKRAFVLSSSRIPFAKSQTIYSSYTRQELMVAALQNLVDKSHLKNQLLGDVALGAVINSVADFNLARECVLKTDLHPHTPAYNVQRACGTGLETTWQIALKIHTGSISIGVAGGVDTNSDVPLEASRELQQALLALHRAKSLGQKLSALSQISFKSLLPIIPNVNEPRTHMSMGQHCELMVKEWKVSRAEQDEIAFSSHKNGSQAYDFGFYENLVCEFAGIKKDATLRSDTTLDRLGKLKPVFDTTGTGTLTAGNSSPLTDGAACVLLSNEDGAQKLGIEPLAQIVDVQCAAVDFVHGAGLLMAPTLAVAQLLQKNKLSFQDFDYIEIHEAFAGQVLCNLKAWESEKYSKEVLGLSSPLGSIDRKKLNTVGSSLALGHPFAATGARIVGTLAKLLKSQGKKRGLISICTAGGMGIAAILES